MSATRKKGAVYLREFNPDEPRDDHGRWTSGGGSSASDVAAHGEPTRPPPDDPRTHKVEQELQSLLKPDGMVSVTEHSEHALEAANATSGVLSEMKARGYKMPDDIIVAAEIGGDIHGQTVFLPAPGASTGLKVLFPASLPPEVTLDTAARYTFNSPDLEPNSFAGTNGIRDVVIHEMGHVQAGHRSTMVGTRGFPSVEESVTARRVSVYAGTNVNEFLAESFTRLYKGEELDGAAMALYNRLDGPKIRP